MKYLLSILLIALLIVPFQPALDASAQAIPTFSIVSVVTDTSVTIQTANFPANRTFTVRMGPIETRAVNGTVVGTTESGSGGSFQATYNIPDSLKGSRQIAIRMDATTGGWFAYNWFNNATSSSTPAATATPGPTPTPRPGGSTTIPTFSIVNVVEDTSVTIRTNNFPAGKTWTARMGAIGTRGVNGTVVGTTTSASGGAFDATFDIPAGLRGANQIAIRLEADTGGWFAYNWFFNNPSTPSTPAATATPGGPTATPAPGGYTGFPTFSIQGVEEGASVTIRTNNLPPSKTFTARMGAMGTRGVNGTVVGTLESGTGGALTATFDIPSSLASAARIAIRIEEPGGYFAYNWFWNATWP